MIDIDMHPLWCPYTGEGDGLMGVHAWVMVVYLMLAWVVVVMVMVPVHRRWVQLHIAAVTLWLLA